MIALEVGYRLISLVDRTKAVSCWEYRSVRKKISQDLGFLLSRFISGTTLI